MLKKCGAAGQRHPQPRPLVASHTVQLPVKQMLSCCVYHAVQLAMPLVAALMTCCYLSCLGGPGTSRSPAGQLPAPAAVQQSQWQTDTTC